MLEWDVHNLQDVKSLEARGVAWADSLLQPLDETKTDDTLILHSLQR